MADPANGLTAMVAGQDGVSGAQGLYRALRAVCQGDHRATGEGQAQKVSQHQVGGRGFHRQQCVIHLGTKG